MSKTFIAMAKEICIVCGKEENVIAISKNLSNCFDEGEIIVEPTICDKCFEKIGPNGDSVALIEIKDANDLSEPLSFKDIAQNHAGPVLVGKISNITDKTEQERIKNMPIKIVPVPEGYIDSISKKVS